MNPTNKFRALLVDTDDYMRLALASLLKDRLSAEVEVCDCLEAAKEKLADEPYSMAVLKLGGGDFVSISQLEGLRAGNQDIKIVVLAESYLKADVLAAVEFDANGCIPLDIGAAKLSEAIQQVAAGYNYYPAPRQIEEPQTTSDVISKLTRRQTDILLLLKDGLSNKMIAHKLDLAEGTVKIHMKALFRTLKVTNRAAAAVVGARFFGNVLAA